MPRADLSRYPRPNVAVDVAALTVYDEQLHVVAVQAPDGLTLPGRFIRHRRTVTQTVREVLEVKLGVEPDQISVPRLLRVFDEPDRDPRGWTLSVAHSVAVPLEELQGMTGRLLPVDHDGRVPEPLLYDHETIVAEATDSLRRRYDRAPDPDLLLRPPYTLSQLRHLHETVIGEGLLKDTFTRRMKPFLKEFRDEAGEPVMSSGVGRPARMYEPADVAAEQTFRWSLRTR